MREGTRSITTELSVSSANRSRFFCALSSTRRSLATCKASFTVWGVTGTSFSREPLDTRWAKWRGVKGQRRARELLAEAGFAGAKLATKFKPPEVVQWLGPRSKSGGALAETGAVSFMFDRVGLVEFAGSVSDADTMLEAAIDAGADDVTSEAQVHRVWCAPERLADMAKALEGRFGEPQKSLLTWKPQTTVPVDDETGEKVVRLVSQLDEHDDVQKVYANFEASDNLLSKLSA